MSRPVRPQGETPAAQIEIERVGNENRRRHDLGAARLLTEGVLQPAEVIVAALRKGARQFGMPDKIGVVVAEGSRPEDMVGMDVSQDHIADRPICLGADRCAQRAALREASAGVDDRHGLIADDKADIGDRIRICRRRLLVHSVVDKDAGRDFRHRQRGGLRATCRRPEHDGDRESGHPHPPNR